MRIYKVFTLLGLFISIFYNCSLPADDEEDSEGEEDCHFRTSLGRRNR